MGVNDREACVDLCFHRWWQARSCHIDYEAAKADEDLFNVLTTYNRLLKMFYSADNYILMHT